MSKLKQCPVCGNRVDLMRHVREDYESDRKPRVMYYFSHHPAPYGFCIIQATLDNKLFTKSRMKNLAKIWNIRDNECHTIEYLPDVEEVELD